MALTTKEKYALGAVVLGTAAVLIYFHYKKSSPAAAVGPAPQQPGLGPSAQPSGPGGMLATSTGPNASVVVQAPEVSSPYQTASSGPVQYTVTTQGTGLAARLRVRSGPGTSYALVGTFDKGATVAATGNVTTTPDADGYTWAEVVDPSTGLPFGWAATAFLTPASPAALSAGMVGAPLPQGRVNWMPQVSPYARRVGARGQMVQRIR